MTVAVPTNSRSCLLRSSSARDGIAIVVRGVTRFSSTMTPTYPSHREGETVVSSCCAPALQGIEGGHVVHVLGPRRSVAFDAAQWLAGLPHLDEQTVSGIREPGQHHFVELGPEQLTGRLALEVAHEHGPTGHLGFSRPSGGIAFGRIDR